MSLSRILLKYVNNLLSENATRLTEKLKVFFFLTKLYLNAIHLVF